MTMRLDDTNPFDQSYHDMLSKILKEGVRKADRTGTGTLSIFGHFQRFDLSRGFPLITTKKVWLKGIVHELLWMLSGSDNVKYLQENGVKIWDDWADNDGSLGPVYGVQWRRWQTYDVANDGERVRLAEPIDQIAQIINKLRSKPWDRRIMLSAWNAGEISAMNLPPCHFNAQFNVQPKNPIVGYDQHMQMTHAEMMDSADKFTEPGKLNCVMNIRSWDTFLGGPFNIAQYALLTMMLAQVAGLEPGELCICSGDTHIYLNHLEQVREQLSRTPRQPPTMILDPSVKEIDDFRYEYFKIENYDPHPHIAGEISV